jgi:hypothetical protein
MHKYMAAAVRVVIAFSISPAVSRLRSDQALTKKASASYCELQIWRGAL